EATGRTEAGPFTLAAGSEVGLVATDEAGGPLRARIALASPHVTDAGSGRDPFLLDHDERVTDASGRCVWGDLPAGRRIVAARAPDGARPRAHAIAPLGLPAPGPLH